ncbi:hypothetical protein J1N35_010673 [Gossypium stocksii]|uniref:Uncharacterized protein n=1 Tax=Gossypium stocksii TaxID=47602 RepID=A0A9D4ACQ6_9ROSI|nr:hypothetical protein J1N35_010673 [Gossypium stocksii]
MGVLTIFVEYWAPHSPTIIDTNNPYSEVLNSQILHHVIELRIGCGVVGMTFCQLGIQDLIITYISPIIFALKHKLKTSCLPFSISGFSFLANPNMVVNNVEKK